MGTRRRNDVDATSLRRIDVVTTSCACWEFGPPLAPQNSEPWPPQYSKPSYAYGIDMQILEKYFYLIIFEKKLVSNIKVGPKSVYKILEIQKASEVICPFRDSNGRTSSEKTFMADVGH